MMQHYRFTLPIGMRLDMKARVWIVKRKDIEIVFEEMFDSNNKTNVLFVNATENAIRDFQKEFKWIGEATLDSLFKTELIERNELKCCLTETDEEYKQRCIFIKELDEIRNQEVQTDPQVLKLVEKALRCENKN